MLRKTSLLLHFGLLVFSLAACTAHEPLRTTTSLNTPTEIPTPIVQASPEFSFPASVMESLAELQNIGYTVKQTAEGISLISPDGHSLLTATAEKQVIVPGKNGETIQIAEGEYHYEMVPTKGVGVEFIQTMKDSEGNIQYMYLDKVGYWDTLAEVGTDLSNPERFPSCEMDDVWSGRLLYTELLTIAKEFPEGTVVPDRYFYNLKHGNQGYYVQLEAVINGLNESSGHENLGINVNNDFQNNCGISLPNSGRSRYDHPFSTNAYV
jgi:hypothetical protein